MSTPQDDRPRGGDAEPTVSTAPTSGTAAEPPTSRWWNWGAVPDHLGRARTSTVILSVLFLAVFALYLNVRPDVTTGGTPSGGGSGGVEAPADPTVPPEPEPTEEPTPTTDPEETATPTTGSTPTTSSPRTTEPGTEPTTPTGTSEPAEPTGGTSEEETPTTTSPSAP